MELGGSFVSFSSSFFFVIKKIVFMASDLVVYRISTLPSISIEMIFLDNFFPFFFTGYYSL